MYFIAMPNKLFALILNHFNELLLDSNIHIIFNRDYLALFIIECILIIITSQS